MELKIEDIRVGNYFKHNDLISGSEYEGIFKWDVAHFSDIDRCKLSIANLEPIPLTAELLEKCGFKKLPHFTVNNTRFIELGRKRVLSVGCVGTPNEMVFISEEEPPVVKDVVCIRNFDYDGYTYFHDIQNIYHAITGKELTIAL